MALHHLLIALNGRMIMNVEVGCLNKNGAPRENHEYWRGFECGNFLLIINSSANHPIRITLKWFSEK
jgi:hypothetical protein